MSRPIGKNMSVRFERVVAIILIFEVVEVFGLTEVVLVVNILGADCRLDQVKSD